MSNASDKRPRSRSAYARQFIGALVVGLNTGCLSASLASSTGPREEGQRWSTASRQKAHVGEEVHFDFVLHDQRKQLVSPIGLVDYCVVFLDGQRQELDADVNGHFSFTHQFDGVEAGDKVDVEVTAFRIRDGRDFMQIHGNWLQNDSPYNRADQALRNDRIRLKFYESPIELELVRPPDDLLKDTGVLLIRGGSDKQTRILLDKPGSRGFIFTGPEPDGFYTISYMPEGNELHPCGVTEVEFSIYDVNHELHEARATLETP